MTERNLPNPAMPTNHPWYETGRHSKVNVFSLIPVAYAHKLDAGDTAPLNVATYIDPFAEMDYRRMVARRPRWQQGLLVRINLLQFARTGEYRDSAVHTNSPADRAFTGDVINHDAELPVVGVMHPDRYGWLAFEQDAFGDEPLRTIADLKHHIGQITSEEALGQYNRFMLYGTFLLDGVEFS